MAWTKPDFTKGQVDRAGELLSHDSPLLDNVDDDEYFQAFEIVNNWRAVHAYPLQMIKMALKRRAKRVCRRAIVAQRLKRLASIRFKLRVSREAGNHPSLSQMQDIGGCRAVLDSVAQVRKVERLFADASKKNPHRGPQYSKTSDYISRPKDNGYRSLHLVYKFRSDSSKHLCYNGQRIEIQLRSRAQHYWATAVETYSTFAGEALKSNIGSAEWMRFFALVSSTIAISEGCQPVPKTASTTSEIVPELRTLYKKLNVSKVLSGWSAATKFTEEDRDRKIKNAEVYLLVLDYDKFTVTTYPYKNEQIAVANAHYQKLEKDHPELQAVLVSVDSISALRAAYPNYFLDTNAFIGIVEETIQQSHPPGGDEATADMDQTT